MPRDSGRARKVRFFIPGAVLDDHWVTDCPDPDAVDISEVPRLDVHAFSIFDDEWWLEHDSLGHPRRTSREAPIGPAPITYIGWVVQRTDVVNNCITGLRLTPEQQREALEWIDPRAAQVILTHMGVLKRYDRYSVRVVSPHNLRWPKNAAPVPDAHQTLPAREEA